MPNGNGEEKGGFFGGFGQSGVKEIKTVTGSTEVTIPLRQTAALWVLGWGGFIFLYIVLRQWFSSREDWLTAIGVVSIVALIPIVIRVWRLIKKHTWPFLYDTNGQLVFVYWDKAVLFIAVCIIAFVVLDFYVSNAVPVLVYILLNETETITSFEQLLKGLRNLLTLSLTCGLFGGIIPLWAGTKFFTDQLTDNLRVSDWHYASEMAKIEWEREKWLAERKAKQLPEYDSNNMPAMMWGASKGRPQLMDSREINKRAIIAFVEGMAGGTIEMKEEAWDTKEALGSSGRVLTRAFGIKMREWLIRAGWVMWRDVLNHALGIQWNPNYKPDEILEEIGGIPNEQFAGFDSKE